MYGHTHYKYTWNGNTQLSRTLAINWNYSTTTTHRSVAIVFLLYCIYYIIDPEEQQFDT